jgi:hypothetical protein
MCNMPTQIHTLPEWHALWHALTQKQNIQLCLVALCAGECAAHQSHDGPLPAISHGMWTQHGPMSPAGMTKDYHHHISTRAVPKCQRCAAGDGPHEEELDASS